MGERGRRGWFPAVFYWRRGGRLSTVPCLSRLRLRYLFITWRFSRRDYFWPGGSIPAGFFFRCFHCCLRIARWLSSLLARFSLHRSASDQGEQPPLWPPCLSR